MTRLLKTLTVLALTVTTFAATPASARIASNGTAVIGIESNAQTTSVDGQALRVIGIELPR